MRKILLLPFILISFTGAVAQSQINIRYQDDSKTHYICKYWCTTPSFNKHSYGHPNDGFVHIIDSALAYGHIKQIEEDYDNLYQELMKDHSYAVVYYKKEDSKVLGYNFDIALLTNYIEDGEVK